MKILAVILLAIVAMPTLSACQASARGEEGYISVGTNDGRYKSGRDDGYYHCPPGHAKKGWC